MKDIKLPNLMNLDIDKRPHKRGWNAGGYICKCSRCTKEYLGAKRSFHCADCAYNDELFGKPAGNCAEIKLEPVKPIDEHEWSDRTLSVETDGEYLEFKVGIVEGDAYATIDFDDVKAMAGYFDCKLTKIGG